MGGRITDVRSAIMRLSEKGFQASNCGMTAAWLANLPQGSIAAAADGSVLLTWQQLDGSLMAVTRFDRSD
jgi:hypothetical protein